VAGFFLNRERREALAFWAITLLVCAVAGVLSYWVGRDWVGRQLGETISSQHVAIRPQEPGQEAKPDGGEDLQPPPAEAKVEMTPREPTEAEKQELTAKALEKEAAEAEATPSAAAPPAETPASATAAESDSRTGGYLVTAGSFTVAANAERVKRDLEAKGYHPYITEVQQRGATYRRVVVGAYGNRQEAEAVRRELTEAGFVAGVIAR